jgi:hypothetical protein
MGQLHTGNMECRVIDWLSQIQRMPVHATRRMYFNVMVVLEQTLHGMYW